MNINWQMSGIEVERESFRQIEKEINPDNFVAEEWPIIRRLIHTTADFSIADNIYFGNNPIEAARNAIANGATIYSDSNMIRSGISIARLNSYGSGYTRESIQCYIADDDVAKAAKENGTTRALAALEKARPILNDAVILIGNAPLALAGIARMIMEENIKPSLVIGMPVGFVHVLESKEMIMQTDIPQVVLRGRRGGSPLAVAALHGMLEK